MTKVRIFVTYKPSVFDPQGDTITKTIHTLGYDEVKDVQVGKFFDVTIDANGDQVAATVKEIAEKLLVNFNMETYTYQVLEDQQ
ncbi:phosphoribosylformylglycinamidine synthase subunit PurS [Limosilactobacillus viscerum]|uniref:phosphoribosylformylglycinamidine synthase subunit PurS n=1 Tax=Limosilactobacillus viscerum TaxID=2993450 RepID=UPI0024BA3020|nr:phosphoribosylformylglycinamidine synthase subunit PurS [Limosilactobacillus viscerum]